MTKVTQPEMTIFFDMDGVLVKYTREDFQEYPLPHDTPGTHYFKYLKQNQHATDMWKIIDEIIQQNASNKLGLGIISTISAGEISTEQRTDKKYWLNEHLGEQIGTLGATISPYNKAKLAEKLLGRKLSRNDILLDDFNRNLREWEKAGGTGVKYLNGLNSQSSWNGCIIDATPDANITPYDNAQKLLTIATN